MTVRILPSNQYTRDRMTIETQTHTETMLSKKNLKTNYSELVSIALKNAF